MEVNEFFAKVRPIVGDNKRKEIPLTVKLNGMHMAEIERFSQLTPLGGKINERYYYHVTSGEFSVSCSLLLYFMSLPQEKMMRTYGGITYDCKYHVCFVCSGI